ncbi:MAG: diguanylate cyclase [Cyanobacteria bacterium RYN_339]|nr:diguanylate cyclase [Cyanobacteria bacterium RYN_339]
MQQAAQIRVVAPEPVKKSKYRPWIEAGALVACMGAIEMALHVHTAPVDLMAVAVVLGGARFGYMVGGGIGLLAGTISLMETPTGPGGALYLLADRGAIAVAFGYIALGALVGLVGDVPREQARRAKDELAATNVGHAALEERYELLMSAKEALDRRIVGQVQTVVSLYEAARELEALDPRKVLGGLLRLMARFLEVESASVYALDGDQLVLAESLGARPERKARLDLATTALGAVARTGRPMPLPAAESDPAGAVLLAAPITRTDGEVRGVLVVEKMPFRQLTPATRQMVDLLADWGSRALANSETYASARDRQRDHPVTGIHQTVYMDDRLPSEWSLARRYKLPLTIIMVRRADLEHADETAWEKGALEVSAVLKQRVRTIDVLGHYRSRDAFLLMLPVTPLEGASILAERLAAAIPGTTVAVGSNGSGLPDGEALLHALYALVTDPAGGPVGVVPNLPPEGGETP